MTNVYGTVRRGVVQRLFKPRAAIKPPEQPAGSAKTYTPTVFDATTTSQVALQKNDFRQGLIIQSPPGAAAIVDINFDQAADANAGGIELAVGGLLLIDSQSSPGNAIHVKSRSGTVRLRITELL